MKKLFSFRENKYKLRNSQELKKNKKTKKLSVIDSKQFSTVLLKYSFPEMFKIFRPEIRYFYDKFKAGDKSERCFR